MSTLEAAARLGLAKTTIQQYCKRLGVDKITIIIADRIARLAYGLCEEDLDRIRAESARRRRAHSERASRWMKQLNAKGNDTSSHE